MCLLQSPCVCRVESQGLRRTGQSLYPLGSASLLNLMLLLYATAFRCSVKLTGTPVLSTGVAAWTVPGGTHYSAVYVSTLLELYGPTLCNPTFEHSFSLKRSLVPVPSLELPELFKSHATHQASCDIS